MRLAIALLILIAAIVMCTIPVLGIFLILAVAAIVLGASIRLVAHYWDPQEEYARPKRQLSLWACKGILIPMLFWILCNTGISVRYPPLITHQRGASRLSAALYTPSRSLRSTRFSTPALLALLYSAIPVALVVGSYWAATSFGGI